MATGAATVGAGILAEFVAPAWSIIPAWLHPLLAANEGLIITGASLFCIAALVRRARGRYMSRDTG